MYLSHQAVHSPLGLPPAGSFSAEETAILDEIKASSNEDGHLRERFAKVNNPSLILFLFGRTRLCCTKALIVYPELHGLWRLNRFPQQDAKNNSMHD